MLTDNNACPPLTAVIVSCLSSFPQLFSQGKTKQKPVWTPTDTYYQRLKLRVKATVKNTSTDHILSSIISVPARSLPELDSKKSLQREQVQYAASYDSLEMEPETPEEVQQPRQTESVVLPMSQPSPQLRNFAASLSGGRPDNDTSPPEKNHITREITYSVTKEPAAVHCKNHQGHSIDLGKQEWSFGAFEPGSHKVLYTGSAYWGNARGT